MEMNEGPLGLSNDASLAVWDILYEQVYLQTGFGVTADLWTNTGTSFSSSSLAISPSKKLRVGRNMH